MKELGRIFLLDVLRGFAICGMIIFHICYLLTLFQVWDINPTKGIFFFLAKITQITFLTLVGIGLSISAKKYSWHTFQIRQWKRVLLILSCAFIVSISTLIFIPNVYVRFGVLHLIGTGILFFSFVGTNTFRALLISLMVFLLTFLKDWWKGPFLWLYPFGFFHRSFASIDFFPIVPWLGVIALGVFFGNIIDFKKLNMPERSPWYSSFAFLGRYALFIYMVHVPIILFVFWIFGIIPTPRQ
jgi:uncharacterized membrane protein